MRGHRVTALNGHAERLERRPVRQGADVAPALEELALGRRIWAAAVERQGVGFAAELRITFADGRPQLEHPGTTAATRAALADLRAWLDGGVPRG